MQSNKLPFAEYTSHSKIVSGDTIDSNCSPIDRLLNLSLICMISPKITNLCHNSGLINSILFIHIVNAGCVNTLLSDSWRTLVEVWYEKYSSLILYV